MGGFITFEGIDGSGKSTQARMLAARLRDAGVDVLLTREPGGSPGAEEIRSLLVDGDPGRWSAMTELLLFNAARRDHWERTIEPALAAGQTVLCDRYVDSTRAYQGAGRAALRPVVDLVHKAAFGAEADLTILIDLSPEKAAARRATRSGAAERFEALGDGFQARVRQEFLALAQAAPKRFLVMDGDMAPEALAAAVAQEVQSRGWTAKRGL